MNKRLVAVALGVSGLLMATAPAAVAAPAAGTPSARDCGAVKLTGKLPVPPAGQTVRQTITIGADCTAHEGPVTYTPVTYTPGAKPSAAKSPAAKSPAAESLTSARRITSANEMYDCCNIRMTGLYTTSDWTAADGRITTAATTATQGFNREPWNAGWSLKSATAGSDCTTDCATVNTQAHADFTYKGIFDTSGDWYANTHHTYLTLNPDLTYSCTFDVQLRHSFIGWNWQRGCQAQ
ncbi:hypothetical protein [Streptomyces sp. NRRL WC-3742]|uniref:hypothetical protein n=1 Tax=Streptomyces sp. NRRL WC-3742 TaxID=1463934 RepID=UPI000B14E0BF|nr:hypothetical protein [Streptomyces sp. NRRL WC-3742]